MSICLQYIPFSYEIEPNKLGLFQVSVQIESILGRRQFIESS